MAPIPETEDPSQGLHRDSQRERAIGQQKEAIIKDITEEKKKLCELEAFID